jgi:hypothetical protein
MVNEVDQIVQNIVKFIPAEEGDINATGRYIPWGAGRISF